MKFFSKKTDFPTKNKVFILLTSKQHFQCDANKFKQFVQNTGYFVSALMEFNIFSQKYCGIYIFEFPLVNSCE